MVPLGAYYKVTHRLSKAEVEYRHETLRMLGGSGVRRKY